MQRAVQLGMHLLATKYGKRSLKNLGPKICDNIDPCLHDSSQLTFEKHYGDLLISAYDHRQYGAETWISLCQL